MLKIIDGMLDEDNIIDLVIGSGSLLKTTFQSKFSQIYGMQKTMLINDLDDCESKQILLQYLQRQTVQAQFLEKLEEDNILTQYQKCLQKSKIKTDIDFQGKFHQYIKVAEKKCKSKSESMTLKTEYEIILKEASKCFKLKASETRQDTMNDDGEGSEGDGSGSHLNDWKIKIPTIKISTDFVCKNCDRNLRNQAGLSMHQKRCGYQKKKIQKKLPKGTRKGLRSCNKDHQ